MTTHQLDRLIEMAALDAEKQGMIAENEWRVQNGSAIAYGEDAFNLLAERYRGLQSEEFKNRRNPGNGEIC